RSRRTQIIPRAEPGGTRGAVTRPRQQYRLAAGFDVRVTDVLDEGLHLSRWWTRRQRNPDGYREVEQHTNHYYPLRPNAQEALDDGLLNAGKHVLSAHERNHDEGKRQPDAHSGDGALPVGSLPEDAENDDRKERGCGQPEGKRHDFGHESERVDPEDAREDDGEADHHTTNEEPAAFGGLRVDDRSVDIVRQGG